MAKGVTQVQVKSKAGNMTRVSCPMLQSEYVRQAQRDCVIVPGVSEEFKQWVATRLAGYEPVNSAAE